MSADKQRWGKAESIPCERCLCDDRMDSSRRDDIARVLDSLTEREALLVKDAAVMGWVQGMRHHDVKYPGDSNVLFKVVDACLAFPEYCPTLSSPRGDL